MGALKGTCTVRRYVVVGDPPEERAKILRGIRAHVFLPIDPAGEIDVSHGWAVMADPEEFDLSTANVFVGDAVTLALRVDTLKPPASVVKRLVAEKLKPLGRKPNKIEKTQATDAVKKKLRGRYYPSSRAFDVVWNVDEGRLLLFSHTKKVAELLIDLFVKSFNLTLVPQGPSHLTSDLSGGKGKLILPTPEMISGFPGLPGRPREDSDEETANG